MSSPEDLTWRPSLPGMSLRVMEDGPAALTLDEACWLIVEAKKAACLEKDIRRWLEDHDFDPDVVMGL